MKRALQKEQWVITDDPLRFKLGNVNFRVDLSAERMRSPDLVGWVEG
ncbi:element excision factor XisH family protein [Coleofasciculus sp. E2-BRE-01]